MNKKGFTLIEILAVIIVLSIILVLTVPKVMEAIDEAQKSSFKVAGEQLLVAINKKIISDPYLGDEEVIYAISDNKFIGDSFPVSGKLPDTGIIKANPDGEFAIMIYNGEYCATKTYLEEKVTVFKSTLEECITEELPVGGEDPEDPEEPEEPEEPPEEPAISVAGYDATKGVNVPILTAGLTPVVWNSTAWVATTESDPNWYSYTTTDKKWANAVSNDGSMWVWIPRFAYQLFTNFHTNSGFGGTMNVKLLMGNTNTTSDSTPIALTPTYTGTSQTNYVVHPAFTFGDKELRGFWMAKFEATMGKAPSNTGTSCNNDLDNVTTENVKIINNISAWRCISVSNAFTNAYNMQTKQAVYGWLDTQVDTHLIKNTEWSAVGYLAQSAYGKGTANIWLNPSSTYTTGCSGTAAGQSQTGTCIPYYTEPRTGTTTNVYGVFDMSGGSSEFTASYINNLVVGGGTYINGQSVAVADAKYKNVYSVGTTDTAFDNYAATETRFGDSMWETSNSGSVANSGYYLDESTMPETTSPWFVRGSHNRAYNGPGLFAFNKTGGGKAPDFTFRPVLLVGDGI